MSQEFLGNLDGITLSREQLDQIEAEVARRQREFAKERSLELRRAMQHNNVEWCAGCFAGLLATARAGLADTERLQWTVTQLRSALQNWGRHHGWCNGPGPLECNCGYRAALETGYEVGAGAVARDPESGNMSSGRVLGSDSQEKT